MNNKDIYYNPYNYNELTPITGIQMQPQQYTTPNSYTLSQFNDMNERINRLERQIKRLEQRLTRLETPYINTTYNNEPDKNMYMM